MLHTLGSGNIISGVEIQKSKTKTDISKCCTLFLEETGIIYEVFPEEQCECWKQKDEETS
jgi:hypothetical protein